MHVGGKAPPLPPSGDTQEQKYNTKPSKQMHFIWNWKGRLKTAIQLIDMFFKNNLVNIVPFNVPKEDWLIYFLVRPFVAPLSEVCLFNFLSLVWFDQFKSSPRWKESAQHNLMSIMYCILEHMRKQWACRVHTHTVSWEALLNFYMGNDSVSMINGAHKIVAAKMGFPCLTFSWTTLGPLK